MRRLVTISYTGLTAGGGVPKFNRDLHAAFPDRECLHFCWDDCTDYVYLTNEWDRAKALNLNLIRRGLIGKDDVIVADGFWAAGLETFPLAVSHSHGIWSHLTHEDVLLDKAPDMPFHHTAQVSFRRQWIRAGKHITAVSDFIAEQMRLQWGFEVDRVINNGVDTELFRPCEREMVLNDLLIVHGVNDRGNANKGWDHIRLLKEKMPAAHVLSLDETHALLNERSHEPFSKAEALAMADIVVHPSGYEGNSMFVAEALACGVPIVGYDVGFLWSVRDREIGYIIPRSMRHPEATVTAVLYGLNDAVAEMGVRARETAVELLSIERFRTEWRSYVEEIENAA